MPVDTRDLNRSVDICTAIRATLSLNRVNYIYLDSLCFKRNVLKVKVEGLELSDVSLKSWNVTVGDRALSSDLKHVSYITQIFEKTYRQKLTVITLTRQMQVFLVIFAAMSRNESNLGQHNLNHTIKLVAK